MYDAFARDVLDQAAPLVNGSHKDATGYAVKDGALVVTLHSSSTSLKDPAAFVGYQGDVAFAVLVERGKSGGSVAAPIAKTFLTELAGG